MRHVKIHGNPQRIPPGTGYYQPIEKSNTYENIIEEIKLNRLDSLVY